MTAPQYRVVQDHPGCINPLPVSQWFPTREKAENFLKAQLTSKWTVLRVIEGVPA